MEAMESACKVKEHFWADRMYLDEKSMRAGCEQILADWSDELEATLMTRNTDNFYEFVTQFCGNGL